MPPTAYSLPVTGSINTGEDMAQLVLTERLGGYDTFLTGVLELNQRRIRVRIITLDDVTVLRPVDPSDLAGTTPTLSGVLHLPHRARRPLVPADLAAEAARQGRALGLLDEAELRYALTFLEEATTTQIRQGRIAVIVAALPSVEGIRRRELAAERRTSQGASMSHSAPALVTVDVGGTLGTAEHPGIIAALVAASPVEAREALRVLRERLHTAPAVTDELVEQLCAALRIPTTAFLRHMRPASLRLFTGTPSALHQMSKYLPVVTLSNVTCVEADLDRLTQLVAPWIAGHFPSCRTGYAKPDRRAFETVASQWGISTSQIVHIGDHWECDILGATRAGARAIWVSGGRTTPGAHRLVRSNVLVATDLSAAAGHVRDLCAWRRR